MKNGNKLAVAYLLILTFSLLTAHYGSKAVTTIAENAPVNRKHTIVIDAGHGGVDGGTTSFSGIPEKEFNLQISLRLNDLLQLLGYKTRMVRSCDESVYTKGETIAQKKASDLKERLKITNESDHTLLLSIHQNHFSDSRYSGAQVFFSNSKESETLAKKLQNTLIQTLNPGSNRQSKKAQGIWLMEHIECTGVLIECGFLSNPVEEALLRSREYQQNLCCVIATTVAQYLASA